MMHEDFVTFEQAAKLKELGFDWKCMKGYAHYPNESVRTFNAQEENINGEYNEWCYSAPTLAQAQKWLREVKKLLIEVGYRSYKKWSGTVSDFRNGRIYTAIDDNNTYEEAISEGIDKALERLTFQNL